MIIFYIIAPIVLALAYYYNLYILVYAVFLLFFINFYSSFTARPNNKMAFAIGVFLLIHNSWLISLHQWVGSISSYLILFGFTLYFFIIIYVFIWVLGFFKRLPGSEFLIPTIWVVFELVLTLGPFGYPLFSIYITQAYSPYLFLSHNIVGAELISFLVIFTAAFTARVIKSKNSGVMKITQLFLPGFLFVFIFTYGIYISKHNQVICNRFLNIIMIQPNIKQSIKMDSQHFYSSFDHYIKLIKLVKKEHKNIDAIILPETLVPALWENHFRQEFLRQGLLDSELLIFGLPIKRLDKIYNSILFYQDGRYQKEYAKNQLVPFGESMPIPFYKSKTQIYYSEGAVPQSVGLSSVKYGVTTCFESAFFKIYRKINNADLFIVLTNDDWFNSWFKELHLRTAIFRAVEFNKYMLFVANTGKTAVISNTGEIKETLKDNSLAYISHKVPISIKEQHHFMYIILSSVIIILVFISVSIILKFI